MSRTVGLDFGTHQTKVCVEEREGVELRYEFFKFKDADGKERFTLPSIISVDSKGLLSYGYLPDNSVDMRRLSRLFRGLGRVLKTKEGKIVRYFKQPTFTSVGYGMQHEDAMNYTIWYLAFILFDLEDRYGQDFSTQMGVPADSERFQRRKELAVSLLLSAFRLVEDVFRNDKRRFLATPVTKLKEMTKIVPYSLERKEEMGILVFPEAYACLNPLMSLKRIPDYMSLMIDIGGGTTDISFFTIDAKEKGLHIYDFCSLDKGLNFLTDAGNADTKRKDSNVKDESEISGEMREAYQEAVDDYCKTLTNRLHREFRNQSKLNRQRLAAALDLRPLIYTGGGSIFGGLRIPFQGFKDIIHVSEREWQTENVADMDRIRERGLCPVLFTAYGLSIQATDDNIKCEPLSEIFKYFREYEAETTYRFGRYSSGEQYDDFKDSH